MDTTGAQVGTQICIKCKTEKPFSDYYKEVNSKNGLRRECKKCRSEAYKEWRESQNPLEKQIRVLAIGIMGRTSRVSGRRGMKSYYNKGIENRLGGNITEVMNFLREHFADDIQAMLDKGMRPSVDRLDSDGHYEESNIQIIDFYQNSLGGATNGGKAAQKSLSHAVVIEDLEIGEITRAPSKTAAAEIIGCGRTTVNDHLKYNSAPIFGRYVITREDLS